MTSIPVAAARAASVVPNPNPGLHRTDFGAPEANILIARIDVHPDLSAAEQMPRGPERKAAVYDALVRTAQSSQQDAMGVLSKLRSAGDVTAVESMVLPNAILVTTAPGRHQAVADALAGVAHVQSVSQNRTWSMDAATGADLVGSTPGFVVPDPDGRAVDGVDAIASGVARIHAPDAWSAGADGTGVTVGVVDTGLDSAHALIASHYRGTNADGTQSHDYNWFDPFTHAATPYDDGEHGTHVAGTIAGGDAGSAIGVAPGAKLIAAKGINGRGFNTTAATLQALQFMLAPTKTDGSAPDPRRGADIINNSWGNADQRDETFLESMHALEAAGIEVVNAAGNDGPREGTVSPPGSYPGFFSVAATTDGDSVASFSSRGPSKFTAPGELTPVVAAPGVNISSAKPGGGTQRMSGTSMAAPHVAGALALLLQAHPQATHAQLLAALTSTAVDVDKPGVDNASGYGRIDVAKALAKLDALLGASLIAPAA